MKLLSARSMVIMFTLISMVATQAEYENKIDNEKIKGTIDIVLVITRDFQKKIGMWDAAKDFFPKNFEIGSGYVRMAVVQLEPSTTGTAVVLPLTDDVNTFTAATPVPDFAIDKPDYKRYVETALNAISASIFPTDGIRSRIVIFGSIPASNDEESKSTKVLEKLCKDKHVFIYAMAVDSAGKENTYGDAQKKSESVLCSKKSGKKELERLFLMADDKKEDFETALKRVKRKVALDVCSWHSMCLFSKEEKCEGSVWKRQSMMIDNQMCQNFMPTIASCTQDDCRKTCDEHWEWQGPLPNCDKTPCKSVLRNGQKPNTSDSTLDKKLYAGCKPVFECSKCESEPETSTDTEDKGQKAQDESGTMLGLALAMFGVVIAIIVVAGGAGYLLVSKRQAEVAEADNKMEVLMTTITQMSTFATQMEKGAAGKKSMVALKK